MGKRWYGIIFASQVIRSRAQAAIQAVFLKRMIRFMLCQIYIVVGNDFSEGSGSSQRSCERILFSGDLHQIILRRILFSSGARGLVWACRDGWCAAYTRTDSKVIYYYKLPFLESASKNKIVKKSSACASVFPRKSPTTSSASSRSSREPKQHRRVMSTKIF